MEAVGLWLIEWWAAFWGILVESGVWLVAGFAIAGALHVLVPRSLLKRALGGTGLWPVVRGALIGAPLPLCSCSVIPTAAGLHRSGASRGATAAFAVASPEVDVPAVGLTWGLLGPWFAVTRPIVAIAIAIATGLALDRDPRGAKGGKRELGSTQGGMDTGSQSGSGQPRTIDLLGASVPVQGGVSKPVASGQVPAKPGSCCSSTPVAEARASCCAEQPPATSTHGMGRKLVEMLRFAFVTLPTSLAAWMLIGLAIAALVTVLVPADWTSEGGLAAGLVGGVITQCLIALVIGVPLYVCATTSTPLAAAMLAAGAHPGAALVFLIAGPATNPATIAWIAKDFGSRSAATYVAVIATGAMAAGVGLNGLLSEHLQLAELVHVHEHGGAVLPQIAGGVLLAVLGVGLVRALRARVRAKRPL